MTKLFLLSVSFLVLTSCGSNSGPMPGYAVGYACRAPVDCGVGASCVEEAGGSCWPLCHSNVDCGPGYTCKSLPRHGESGHDDVCVPK